MIPGRPRFQQQNIRLNRLRQQEEAGRPAEHFTMQERRILAHQRRMALLGFVLNEEGTEWVPQEEITETHPPAPVVDAPREQIGGNVAFLRLVETVREVTAPPEPEVSADPPSEPQEPLLIALKRSGGSACPYCRDDLAEGSADVHRCDDCGTALHWECWSELNAACPTLGCSYRMRHRARHDIPDTLRVNLTPRAAVMEEAEEALQEVQAAVEEDSALVAQARAERKRLLHAFWIMLAVAALLPLLIKILTPS